MLRMEGDARVHTYLGNKPASSEEDATRIITSITDQYKKNGIGRWAVIWRRNGDFAGWAGLKYEEQLRELPYYDLGYRLHPDYWGLGIASECALEALKYGFETLGLETINAAAHPDNAASNRVLEKSGMDRIDTFEYKGSKHHWYEMNRESWKIRRRSL